MGSYWVSLSEAAIAANFASLTENYKVNQQPVLQLDPDLLYTPGGGPGFFIFYVRDELTDRLIRRIWISGATKIDEPIFCLDVRDEGIERPDLSSIISKSTKKLLERKPNILIRDAYLVVYSFPKIGVEILWKDAMSGESGATTLDIYSLEAVALADSALSDSIGQRDLIADTKSSRLFFEATASRSKRQEDYAKLVELRDPDRAGTITFQAGVATNAEDEMELKVLSSALGGAVGEFPLVAQIDEWHCSLASAEMVARYISPANFKNQTELEDVFKYVPSRGCTTDDQYEGYVEILSVTGVRPRVDFSPSFDDVRSCISSDFPLRSAIPGHARCCCGYRIKTMRVADRSVTAAELLIHDPYPPGQGEIRWEMIGGVRHDNLILFERGA